MPYVNLKDPALDQANPAACGTRITARVLIPASTSLFSTIQSSVVRLQRVAGRTRARIAMRTSGFRFIWKAKDGYHLPSWRFYIRIVPNHEITRKREKKTTTIIIIIHYIVVVLCIL